jgi:hypothetical protein
MELGRHRASPRCYRGCSDAGVIAMSDGTLICPDCGSQLNLVIPGFRRATDHEARRLTPHLIRILGLCTNPWCVGTRRASLHT